MSSESALLHVAVLWAPDNISGLWTLSLALALHLQCDCHRFLAIFISLVKSFSNPGSRECSCSYVSGIKSCSHPQGKTRRDVNVLRSVPWEGRERASGDSGWKNHGCAFNASDGLSALGAGSKTMKNKTRKDTTSTKSGGKKNHRRGPYFNCTRRAFDYK